MKLTNPSLIRGLGKTGSPNRRGLLTGAPTTQGLADTATPLVRDPGKGGQPLKVTQLVSVLSSGTISSDSAETTIQTLAIFRALGSELDINGYFEVVPFAGNLGWGPTYTAIVKLKRDGTLLATFNLPIPNVDAAGTAANNRYAGGFFVPWVDTDNVSGVMTYTMTVVVDSFSTTNIDVTVRNRYIRHLERRL